MKRKTKRIQFRVSNDEFLFFQYLKDKNISISKHLLYAVKKTEIYKKYDNLLNGGY